MDQSNTRSEPAATSRPSRPSRPTSRPAEPSPDRPNSSSRSTRSTSSRSQSLASPQAPAQPTVSTSHNEPEPSYPSSSQGLRETQSGGFAAASGVPDSSTSSPPATTIIAASVGGAIALLAALAFFICLRRRRKSAPPPARFSNWIDDRAARTHTVYDKSETDPYASESLYALKPSDSSIMKASPTSDGPTAFLPLPVRGRTPTDSWTSSGTPSLAGSPAPVNPPMSASSSTGSPGADADFDRSLPSAPFAAAALAQRGSRQSLSPSRESPDTSPAPTPPPMEANTFLASGAASIRSSRYAQSLSRRSTMMRPVSIAASAHGQRNSIYSVTASTIRGAPHHAHNRVEIVLPAPLDPETYVPVAPFMTTHSGTGSDRSRYSVSTYRGPAWREHSPSPSREGSTREDDATSFRSHRSASQRSLTGPSQESDARYSPYSESLPPVPPLPASVAVSRAGSPKASLRSESPSQYAATRRAPSSLSHADNGDIPLSAATTDYATPIGSPSTDLASPVPRFAAASALQNRMSLEKLAAAAVDTLLVDMRKPEARQ